VINRVAADARTLAEIRVNELGRIMARMLDRLGEIDRDDRALGGNRTPTDQLTHALNALVAVIDAIRAAGGTVPQALIVAAVAATQHHTEASTNRLFINPEKVTSKASPADAVEQANEVLVTALCDFLIVNGEAPRATFTRIDRALRDAGIELPGERLQTQGGQTSGATRLQNWRKKANSGRRPASYLEMYESARAQMRETAALISRDETVTALMHEALVGCVVKMVSSQVVR